MSFGEHQSESIMRQCAFEGLGSRFVLDLERVPKYIRAVHATSPPDGIGEWDALDQLDDEPVEDESITVFRLHEKSNMHIEYTDKKTGRRCGKWLSLATYRLHSEQPGNAARDNDAWRKWATDQLAKETPDEV